MFPDNLFVTAVRHVRAHVLDLTFSDGTRGELDFHPLIAGKGGIFQPLEQPDFFKKVQLNSEVGTVYWPNEVDFDPEVLYSLITGKPIPWATKPDAPIKAG